MMLFSSGVHWEEMSVILRVLLKNCPTVEKNHISVTRSRPNWTNFNEFLIKMQNFSFSAFENNVCNVAAFFSGTQQAHDA